MTGREKKTLSDLEEEMETKGFVHNSLYFLLFSGIGLVVLLSVAAALCWASQGSGGNYILPDN